MPTVLTATSADGTKLAAEVDGAGPPILLVHGSTADHRRWAPLVPLLRDDFTLVMLDRRGRGGSADEAAGYALDREGDDLVAMLEVLDGPAMVFGHSYGALCTLNVLERLAGCHAALLYEPPFATSGNPVFSDEQLARWSLVLDEGRREDLLVMFYREALLFDDAAIDALRGLPIWQARIAAVHTVVREAREVRQYAPTRRHAPFPVRFLLGEKTAPHLAASTRMAAETTPDSDLHILRGQGHVAIDAAPELIAHHVRETWALPNS